MREGFASLTAMEREAQYDFSFQFADDMQLREGRKQEILAVMQILASLPVFAQDPAAQYRMAVELCEVFNLDFTQIMQEPPAWFAPRTPSQEWTMLLQGEDITVHPGDNDQAHIEDHENRVTAMAMSKPEHQDWDAMLEMKKHIADHEQQMLAKQQAQEVMQGLQALVQTAQAGMNGGGQDPMGQLGQMMQGGGGGGMPPGGGGMPPPQQGGGGMPMQGGMQGGM